ncbi:MAG: hypothetical protein QNK37_18160 [Acidobacteriota bacterium]|nr:hypothetical protein [Acidobacteriota bacterium]
MKRAVVLIFFVAFALLLAVGIAEMTNLSLVPSLGIAGVCALLGYLMMDLRPEADPRDATIVRLTKGSWHRKRR